MRPWRHVALLALATAGCGKKLPPEAPLQLIPARVEPLKVAQEGTDVVLRFPYPARTVLGTSLTDLTKVTVYREVLPAPPGARLPSAPADEEPARRERDEKSFLTRAEVVRELTRGDLDDATYGGEVIVRDSLVPLFVEKRMGRIFTRYAVTATRERKKSSRLSPMVALAPKVPPDMPVRILTTPEEGRVCLDWLPPHLMLGGETPVKVAAYAVYRREESEDSYGDPIGITGPVPTFVDTSIAPEKRYVYTVRAAPATDAPLVLGPPADQVTVDTHDVFPPPAPEGLLVLSESGANRLVWNPVLVQDLAGYLVYRRVDPAPFARLGQVKDPSYLDQGPPAGAVYGVSAIDKSGNEGPRAEARGGR